MFPSGIQDKISKSGNVMEILVQLEPMDNDYRRDGKLTVVRWFCLCSQKLKYIPKL